MTKQILIYSSIPIIAALIGWFTNFIAVKMIFRPRREINILGFRLQGLIPKRKAALAMTIAETVEKELISHRDIREILQTQEFHDRTEQILSTKLNEIVATKIDNNPLLTLFVSPDLTKKLIGMFIDELRKNMPAIIDSLFEEVEEKIDFKKIIQSKIENFDMMRLESIIYTISSKELKAIELLGGVLGFLVGIVQVLIVLIGRING